MMMLNAKRMLKTLGLAAVMGALVGCEPAPHPSELAGAWSSPKCESFSNPDGSKNYVRRRFVNTDKTWEVVATAFGDANCTAGDEFLKFRVGGTFTLGAASQAAPGAREGSFNMDHKFITAMNATAAQFLGSMNCGDFQAGVERDVSANGCLTVPADSVCKTQYDIVKVDGDTLAFGVEPAGPASICTPADRPTQLFDPVVREK